MSSVLKHWKEAATLLLAAKTRVPSVTAFQTTNYELLMLKRSGKSKFMPKLHVFPGGMSHDADFSPKWIEIFKQADVDVHGLMNDFLLRGGAGAHMFSRKRPEKFSQIPSELAFRICAIRETFEEAGILLVRDMNIVKNEKTDSKPQPMSGKTSILSDSILLPWREKVDNDAEQFIHMCLELKVVPDVWSLYEWSNWLTPVGLTGEGERGRRYDTAFFMCVLDYIPHAVQDNKETTELEWASASKFLLSHANGKSALQLAPPQIIELTRLLNFTDAEHLKHFAYDRSAVRAIRYLPVICTCDDGMIFLYPGDDLYPAQPDYEGTRSIMSVSGTLEELRIKFPNHNRSEVIQSENGIKRNMLCNIRMADGQVTTPSNWNVEMLPKLPHASL